MDPTMGLLLDVSNRRNSLGGNGPHANDGIHGFPVYMAASCTPCSRDSCGELVEAGRQPKYPEDMGRLNALLDALIEEYRDDYP